MKNGKSNKVVRVGMSISEAEMYYAYLGGKIGQLTDWNAIRDGRASEIAKEVADLKLLQDRVAQQIRKAQEEDEPEAAPQPAPEPVDNKQSKSASFSFDERGKA